MTIKKIIYFASNLAIDTTTIGDTSPDSCQFYRDWAKSKIELQYPGVEVEIVDSGKELKAVVESDDKKADQAAIVEIADYCSHVFNSSPWNTP